MSGFGHFPRVQVRASGETRLPPDLQAIADRHWEELLASGRPLYRGPVLRATGLTITGDEAVVQAEWSDYAHLMAARSGLLPKSWQCRTLFGAALVVTADGLVVVGQMDPSTAQPGRWQLPGGGAEPVDAPDGLLSAEHLVARELEEEIGLVLTAPPVVESRFAGGILAEDGAGAMAVLIRLGWTLGELLNHFNGWSDALRNRGDVPEFMRLAGDTDPEVGPIAPVSLAWVRWWRARNPAPGRTRDPGRVDEGP